MKATLLQAILVFAPTVLGRWPEAEGKAIKYSAVQGYFLQDDPATDPGKFDYVR